MNAHRERDIVRARETYEELIRQGCSRESAALAAERQALVDKRQRLIGLRNAVQVFDDELATKLAASVANKQPYQPTAKFIADRKAAREALAVFQDRPSE